MTVTARAETLYTPAILALATELARYPMPEAPAFYGEARSPACGSTLAIGLDLDETEAIGRFGLRVAACAIGQASAAIFARHAAGSSPARIAAAQDAVAQWLAHDGPLPDWPELGQIEAARAYPARHGAILLPWKAAVQALSKG